MRYCSHCHVICENKDQMCIVCGRNMTESNYEESIVKVGYPNVLEVKKSSLLWLRILGSIFLALSLTSVTINLLTLNEYRAPWSLIIVGTCLYIWLLIHQVIISKHDYTTKTIRQVFIVSVILVLIDMLTGHGKWAITYTIPFILLGTTILLPLIVATMPKKYFLHVRSLLLLICINILYMFIPFMTDWGVVDVSWPFAMVGLAGISLDRK